MRKKSNDERYEEGKRSLSKIKVSNIFYPIFIGLGVVGYLVYDEFDVAIFSQLQLNAKSIFWLFISVLFMFGRDIGYIIRIRIFSEGKISWYECFRVIMLWEFTSAVTPSAIGGTSVAIVFVNKAGMSVGKSTSIVLLTSFFDELYFAIMFPVVILLIGHSELFNIATSGSSVMSSSFFVMATIGYALKMSYLLLITYGIFFNPRGLKWLIIKIFSFRFLRKWLDSAIKAGDDLVVSSMELKTKSVSFWIKSFLATALSWSSRYLVVNSILLAFFTVEDHLLLFGRQLVMWIMMLIMPTPGGSGFSEYLFAEYLTDFIPVTSLAIIIALIWRLITYYPYLIIGAIVFPRWLSAKFGKK